MTKAQKLRRRMGDPYRSGPGDGPLPSPRDCMRTRGTGRRCDTCHAIPIVLHVPTRLAGQFCPRCCPVCRQEVAAA